MDEILKDDRFSHILTDPSFRRIPKKVRKIKVDNRFKKLMKNKKFKEKCSVDERGCALKLDSSENLRKLYNMDETPSDSDEESDENKIEKVKNAKHKNKKSEEKKDESLEEQDNGISFSKSADLNKVKKKNKELKHKDKSSTSESIEKINLNDNEVNVLSDSNSIDSNKSPGSDNLNKNFKKRKELGSQKIDLRFQKETDSGKETSSEDESDDDSIEQIASENEDSSEDDSDDSNSDDSESKTNDTFDHQWEEQHERAPDTNEITKRLAVCHMDWDRIRAVDLYAVFNSFKPPDSAILSVKIYPSEFGLQRMEEERLKGPRELVEKTLASDEEEVEDKKGGKYNREKLRQYQMNRLKYYYAVVECDTSETANTLYEQLNGMEYESSSVRFDLRFIPDDMTFDQEPTSTAENPNLSEYKPKLFVTTALQQVKVGLTWDETDPHRREILQKAFTEPDDIEKDIQEYLASSSEESEEEVTDGKEDNRKLSTKERIEKYKALLESINEQDKEKSGEKYEMEITWESGAKEKTETLVKKKLEEKSYTPFEELQKKRKEKQKLKKKAVTSEPEDDTSSSDSDATTEHKIDNIKSSKTNDELYLIADAKKEENEQSTNKKKKKVKQETKNDFQVDINDPRFSALYTSPLYNIDPSDPHFKSTPGNLAIIAEKQRRLKNKNGPTEETKIEKKMKYR